MIKLSVNLNKIATLRNSRGGNIPNLLQVASDVQKFGCHGITVHPRPDQRHITYQDVYDLNSIISEKIDFNIEGNPTNKEFMDLVLNIRPKQVTLVPDSYNAITSESGWDTKFHFKFLLSKIKKLKNYGIRTSIFINAIPDDRFYYAHKTNTDCIELYTGTFAKNYEKNDLTCINNYILSAKKSIFYNLKIHAGHDLNLDNLSFFIKKVPGLSELSIGHSLIADSLYMGLENAIQIYLKKMKE